MEEQVSSKKDRQLAFALRKDASSLVDSGFDNYRFEHNALPEIDFSEIDVSMEFLRRKLKMPLIISSITGGGSKSEYVNRSLAKLANDYGIGFAVGSQTCALKYPSLEKSFKVRSDAPNALILANIGAVELNHGFSIDECKKAVDMIGADALILHLNPLHEIFQENGKVNFSGLVKKIEKVCANLNAPVIVKEVGYGISASSAKKLEDAGVYAVEVAGAGSISWSAIEKTALRDAAMQAAADSFRDWGNPTAECVKSIAENTDRLKIIASGGVDTGVKMAKSIALGADLCGNASVFLQKIIKSRAECENFMETIILELKTAMFCTGSKNLNELKKAKIYKTREMKVS